MALTRQNVFNLGSDWAEPILWYARGVKAMKTKTDDLADRNGWRFYAAIHGFDDQVWQQLGFWKPSDNMPPNGEQKLFWSQCQHGSWYFLPWHRGYLLAFEAVVRAEIAKVLGGPTDWTLPYWNYFKSGQNQLPPAFASPDWPDGTGDNPLFVNQRYGPNDNGKVFVDTSQVDLNAMGDSDFTGVANGGPLGFGGPDTGFMHGGRHHGGLEAQPHDMVHVLVGGFNRPGLMSDPDTAGLDPIFWLHHANIDRLWEVWRQDPAGRANPREPNWLNGPVSVGQRKFSLPMAGGTQWDYTPADMADLAKLGYTYDDLSPVAGVEHPADRLERLGIRSAITEGVKGVAPVETRKRVELIGSSSTPLHIAGTEARATVRLDPAVRRKVAASLEAVDVEAPAEPDRVFLNLENIRAISGSPALQIYIKAPGRPEVRAGSVGLFGLRKASDKDLEHAGQGLSFVLDITKVVDALHLSHALDVDALEIRVAPLKPVPEEAQLSIGKLSLFRQGR